MKRQKKQRTPIAGQRWYEKILDWLAGDACWRCVVIYHFLALAYLGIWTFFTIIFEASEDAFVFLEPLFAGYIFCLPVAVLHIVGISWGLRAERKLQKPILNCVEQYGNRTYNELVSNCMPVKIHLGIDDALEWLLRTRELVLYTNEQGENCYRLPTEEDRENWHREFLKENGETLKVEELQRILSMDSRYFGDGILIWFFLGEQDEFWMGKTEREDSDEQAIWIEANDVPYQEFMTFEELIQAKLIRGKSLCEIWDELVFLSIEGESPSSWYERICGDEGV
ncbi:MAG: hypothetical protein IKB79_00795 [Oscillospiraceae bacterium]|nr:hypothetical protein [Oscillospiraceae bacterium]